MANDVRWLVVAVIMGLITAYALWGDRAAPPNTPIVASPTASGPEATPVKSPTQTAPTLPSSALRFSPPKVDFGEVLVGQNKSATVTVTNSGSASLTVGSVTGSCGCLKAEMLQRKLEPGQGAPLMMTYIGLSGKRPEKYLVTLITDEPGQPNVKLDVTAVVKQEFNFEPQQLSFEQIRKGESKTVPVVLSHRNNMPFKIRDIVSKRKELSFKWDASDAGGSAYKILATMTGLTSGALTDSVAVHTDHPQLPVVSFDVFGVIVGELTATPPVLSATQMPNLKATPFETVLKLAAPRAGEQRKELNGGLQIVSITESEGAELKFETLTSEDGALQLTIRLEKEFTRNPAVGEFVIQTNAQEDALKLPFRVLRPGPPVRMPLLSLALRGLAPPPETKIQTPLLPPQPRRVGPAGQP